MNPEIKTLWTSALRSGKYKKNKGHLAYQAKNGSRKFCCLGVLCDLYIQEHPENKWSEPNFNELSFLGNRHVLPVEVQRWAGLADENPNVNNGQSLAHHNDFRGLTFRAIADLIDTSF